MKVKKKCIKKWYPALPKFFYLFKNISALFCMFLYTHSQIYRREREREILQFFSIFFKKNQEYLTKNDIENNIEWRFV